VLAKSCCFVVSRVGAYFIGAVELLVDTGSASRKLAVIGLLLGHGILQWETGKRVTDLYGGKATWRPGITCKSIQEDKVEIR